MKLYHITLLKNKKSIQTHGLLDLKHNLGIYFTDNPKKSLEWMVTLHDLIFANPQEKYLMVEVDYDKKIHKKWNNPHIWNSMMNQKGDEYICLKSMKPDTMKFYEVSYEHETKKYKIFKNLKNNPLKISWMDMVEVSNDLKYSKPSWNQIVDMSLKLDLMSTGIEVQDDKTIEYSDEIFDGILGSVTKHNKKEIHLHKEIVKSGMGQLKPLLYTNKNSKYIPTKNIY